MCVCVCKESESMHNIVVCTHWYIRTTLWNEKICIRYRYVFGAENAFILLQPMYSFAIHDIGKDTPHTNWDYPVTVRDKIRVSYKENDRGYHIRDTIVYPAAHDIVKPLKEGTGEVIEWWKDPNSPEEENREDEESSKLHKESRVFRGRFRTFT